jgi:ATP-dependent Zn protease
MSKHQTITYLGRVLDQKKQAPISRAKVLLTYEGNSVITYTDLEGIYRLTINFNNSNSLQAQLSIQANSYKNYNSLIKLSPKQKDLGDVRLVDINSNFNSSSNIKSSSSSSSSYDSSSKLNSQPQENSFIPLPIIIVIMMVMFFMIAIAFKPSSQRNPVNRRNTLSNLYRQTQIFSHFCSVDAPSS